MNQREALLALNRIKGIGPRTIQSLIQQGVLCDELFSFSMPALRAVGLSEHQARALSLFDTFQIGKDLEWEAADSRHHLLTLQDESYPLLLKEIPDPPPVLYAKGNLEALSFSKISMVGTRKPSLSGLETARSFARDLCRRNIAPVSGLAIGIDTAVHQSAVFSDFATIAVMATGIDKIYPRSNQGLSQKITEKGLLLTEFPLETEPLAGHFPRRNRIISGLSLATLVVEASIRSGSLITARFAMEQNRDVLAVPGSIHHAEARGCHHLIQQGAKLVVSIEDIFDEVGRFYEVEPPQATLKEFHKSPELSLLEMIGFGHTTSVDTIVSHSGLALDTVLSVLARLEIDNLIKAVLGGYVRVCSE